MDLREYSPPTARLTPSRGARRDGEQLLVEMSMFSLKGWGWDREGCLFTSVQGYYVLGKMQDLMKQDFLGATEPPGRKASSAAQSSQETGPERKEFN